MVLFVISHSVASLTINQQRREMDSVVIWRTARPMPGMLSRMLDVYNDLQTNAPNVQFTISIDTSKHSDVETRIKAHVPQALTHAYTWDEVKQRYPVHVHDNEHSETRFASPYAWHMEPILLAKRYISQHTLIAQNASWWVFEDDVFVCHGSVSQFIKLYDGVQSDLLTLRYNETMEWAHRDSASELFKTVFPPSARWRSLEQVQRYSPHFLEHMEKEIQNNISAQSEMFAPTECVNNQHKFRCSTFKSEHIGVFDWNTRFHSEMEAESICGNSESLTINHAAKYRQGPLYWLSADKNEWRDGNACQRNFRQALLFCTD